MSEIFVEAEAEIETVAEAETETVAEAETETVAEAETETVAETTAETAPVVAITDNLILAQIGAQSETTKSSVDVDAEVGALISELTPMVGGIDKASDMVLKALDSLKGNFDDV